MEDDRKDGADAIDSKNLGATGKLLYRENYALECSMGDHSVARPRDDCTSLIHESSSRMMLSSSKTGSLNGLKADDESCSGGSDGWNDSLPCLNAGSSKPASLSNDMKFQNGWADTEAELQPVVLENVNGDKDNVNETPVDALLREKNITELAGISGRVSDVPDGSSFADQERQTAENRRPLRQWPAFEFSVEQTGTVGQRLALPAAGGSAKRERDDNLVDVSPVPAKAARISSGDVQNTESTSSSAPTPHRLRYKIAELLVLRHDRKNTLLNRYSFSKSCDSPDAVVVSRADELAVGADGRLRSTDVLLPNADEETPATFESMLLPDAVVKGLRKAGFTAPSPVQYRGIPVGRIGADIVAQAKSGTGKTVVFAALIAEIAIGAPAGQIVALVLAPTREIARQVRQVVSDVLPGSGTGKTKDVALLVGGSPVRRDVEALRRARVAVGTPGRVRALLERGDFDGAHVRMLVLDEADRLLDPSAGFALGALAGCLAEQRQTLAFSATYTPKLVAQLRKIMRTPQLVWLGDERTMDAEDGAMHRAAVLRAVSQFRVDIGGYGAKAKAGVFVQVLSMHEFSGCIAFAAQRDAVAHYAKQARKAGFAAKHVSAALNEKDRLAVVQEFEQGSVNVLVCTDLMARGVSFDMCDFVVQLDVAVNTQTHLHRVGRAGRFGTTGVGVVIVEEAQRGDIGEIERNIGTLPQWPCAKDIVSKCVVESKRSAMKTKISESNCSTEAKEVLQVSGNGVAKGDVQAQTDMKILETAWTQRIEPERASAKRTQTEGDCVPEAAERTLPVAMVLLEGSGNLAKLEDNSAGKSLMHERLETGSTCSHDTVDEPGDAGGREAQSAELSAECMSSMRGRAWAAGFAQGYQRAWDLIRQLSAYC